MSTIISVAGACISHWRIAPRHCAGDGTRAGFGRGDAAARLRADNRRESRSGSFFLLSLAFFASLRFDSRHVCSDRRVSSCSCATSSRSSRRRASRVCFSSSRVWLSARTTKRSRATRSSDWCARHSRLGEGDPEMTILLLSHLKRLIELETTVFTAYFRFT